MNKNLRKVFVILIILILVTGAVPSSNFALTILIIMGLIIMVLVAAVIGWIKKKEQ